MIKKVVKYDETFQYKYRSNERVVNDNVEQQFIFP